MQDRLARVSLSLASNFMYQSKEKGNQEQEEKKKLTFLQREYLEMKMERSKLIRDGVEEKESLLQEKAERFWFGKPGEKKASE